MKKNMFKLGALSLALVAALAVLFSNNANAQTQTGELSLTINSGTSYCVYGTSINLGSKQVLPDFGALTFTGNFIASGDNTWYCTDYAGTPGGWDLTIQTSNLINANSNVISGSNVVMSHGIPTVTAGSCATTGAAATLLAIDTTHSIISKTNTSPNRTVCTVTTTGVYIQVNVPAYQAPGYYTGTLTVTLPTFN